MEIRALLEKLGYKNLLSDDWYKRIDTWLKWYGGKAKFHEYRIYNGQQFVSCVRKSLGMAKKVAEDKADLLLNEKVEITLAGKVKKDDKGVEVKTANPNQETLDDILDKNNFWVRGNQLVELANALGTGAFVEFLEKGEVRIDYIPATNIWPLSWRNNNVVECAFASHLSDDKTYIQLHVLTDKNGNMLDGGRYVVYNYLFDKEGKQVALPQGVLPTWKTGSEKPMFQIITPNIANNIDISNPMGISVYANCIDDLETADIAYDSFHNEFKLGKKRIFVKDGLVKVDLESGDPVPVFDVNDTVFYSIPGEDDAKKLIEESNMELRVSEHIDAIQTALDIISEKCGFGKGYYRFDGRTGEIKTATEVVSQNSKLFRRIKKDEIILGKALTDMVEAILFLAGKGTDSEISISFDDSIIEDTDAIAKRAMLEKNSGIIDDVEYFIQTRGLEEQAAIDLVNKIKARKPPEPQTPEFDTGGD